MALVCKQCSEGQSIAQYCPKEYRPLGDGLWTAEFHCCGKQRGQFEDLFLDVPVGGYAGDGRIWPDLLYGD